MPLNFKAWQIWLLRLQQDTPTTQTARAQDTSMLHAICKLYVNSQQPDCFSLPGCVKHSAPQSHAHLSLRDFGTVQRQDTAQVYPLAAAVLP